jgi:hypothetical protein
MPKQKNTNKMSANEILGKKHNRNNPAASIVRNTSNIAISNNRYECIPLPTSPNIFLYEHVLIYNIILYIDSI